jgi:hypothetical protein
VFERNRLTKRLMAAMPLRDSTDGFGHGTPLALRPTSDEGRDMNERQKQTVFLKRLLQKEESEQQLRLQNQIARAERDEKCVCSAMKLVGVMGLLAFCGLCYEAIFVEDFFMNPTHLMTRLLGYLGLGSLICWVMFVGYWLWHRALTNRLYEEGRRVLIARVEQGPAVMLLPDCPTTSEDNVPQQDTLPTPYPHSLPKAA